MKLVIMTRPTFFVEEDKILEALFEEGLDDLHLYKPDAAPVYLERLLSLLPEDTHKKITVHSHYYLKNEYGLAGIHLDTADMERPDGYRGTFSRSCDDLSLLKEAKKKSRYVFLHNIFDSLTHPAHHATFPLHSLQEASHRGLIDRHVYAMGGMSIDNVKAARDMGFGGVVICGDIWSRFNIQQESDYKQIIAHFNKLQSAVG